MGGEASGEVASQMCVDTVPARFFENLKSLGGVRETNFVLLLREAIEYANQLIFQKAGGNPAYRRIVWAALVCGAGRRFAGVSGSRQEDCTIDTGPDIP